MKDKTLDILYQLIKEREKKYGIIMKKHVVTENVVPIKSRIENYHLFLTLENGMVPSLQIQYSIAYENDQYVRCLIFPSPIIINKQTINDFVGFANASNRYVLKGLGRFWVDIEKYDFAYEILLSSEFIIDNKNEVGHQFFDLPLAHFTDFITPLYMLGTGHWQADIAIKYLDELREKGYVNNNDYGIT